MGSGSVLPWAAQPGLDRRRSRRSMASSISSSGVSGRPLMARSRARAARAMRAEVRRLLRRRPAARRRPTAATRRPRLLRLGAPAGPAPAGPSPGPARAPPGSAIPTWASSDRGSISSTRWKYLLGVAGPVVLHGQLRALEPELALLGEQARPCRLPCANSARIRVQSFARLTARSTAVTRKPGCPQRVVGLARPPPAPRPGGPGCPAAATGARPRRPPSAAATAGRRPRRR